MVVAAASASTRDVTTRVENEFSFLVMIGMG